MDWHIDGSEALYLQLAADLRHAIICGALAAGSRIPSVRELASDARVNPNTMQRALSELERDGLVITHGTSGKFVTDESGALDSARQRELLSLALDFKSRAEALGFTVGEAAEYVLRHAAAERTEQI